MVLPVVKIKFEVDPTSAKRGLADIQKAVKATGAATKTYQKALSALKGAQDTGLLSLKRYDAELRKLDADFDRSAQAAAKLAGATAKIVPTTVKQGLDTLRNSLAATDAATIKYANDVETLKRSLATGLLTTKQYDLELKRLTADFDRSALAARRLAGASASISGSLSRTSGAFSKLRGSSRQAQFALQNVGFQLQDIVVQVQGGQGLTRALSQQLPQLLGGFGAKMTFIGLAVGLAIPLFAALAKNMDLFGDSTKEASDELQSLLDKIELQKFKVGTDEEAKAMRARLESTAKLIELEEKRTATKSATGAETRLTAGRLSSLDKEIASHRKIVEASNKTLKSFRDARNELRELEKVTGDVEGSVKGLEDATAANAKETAAGLVRAEELYQTQIAALADVREQLGLNEDALIRLPDSIKLAAEQMLLFEIATAGSKEEVILLEKELAALRDAMFGMETGVPLNLQGFTPAGLLPPKEDDDGDGGGGGRTDTGPLDALIKRLQTEREILDTTFEENLALLMDANATQLEAIGGFNEARLRLEEEFQQEKSDIEQAADAQRLGNLGTVFSNLSSAFASGSGKMLKISKAFGIASGLINAYGAYLKVLDDPSLLGTPVFRQILAGSTLAAGLAQVANIRSVSAGGGGGGGATSAPAVSAPAPLNVRVSGLGPADLISGNQLSELFDKLQDEAGDRGLIVSFAT